MAKQLSKSQKKRILSEVAAVASDMKFVSPEPVQAHDLVEKNGDPLEAIAESPEA
jgi:hypothetical protein